MNWANRCSLPRLAICPYVAHHPSTKEMRQDSLGHDNDSKLGILFWLQGLIPCFPSLAYCL